MAYDWNKLKTEYATGTASQRELAEKHGISPSALMRQARLSSTINPRMLAFGDLFMQIYSKRRH